MAYWVKAYETEDYTFTEEGDRVSYVYKRYIGPFRSVSEAEKEIDNAWNEWEIVEFD